MLDAKSSSGMSEEEFAAWLEPFGLSQDRLFKCLELGRAALDRRTADAAEREESFRSIVKERRAQVSGEAVRHEENQWAGQWEESGRQQDARHNSRQ
jgi:hypothetical protein